MAVEDSNAKGNGHDNGNHGARPLIPEILSKRERKFVAGVVAGKTKMQAAIDAGYTPETARAKSYSFLNRPLVRSAITDALERLGVTYERMVQPVADALEATKFVPAGSRETLDGTKSEYVEIPDHPTRLAAHDRAIALVGAVPKVGEATPAAHGLTLIVKSSKTTQITNIHQAPAEALATSASSTPPVAVRITSHPGGSPIGRPNGSGSHGPSAKTTTSEEA